MKKILIALTLVLALFSYSCDSSSPQVTIDPNRADANITVKSGDALHAPSDTVQLSYDLASGNVNGCINNGNITAENTKSNTNDILTNILYAGGIVGLNEGTGSVTNCEIANGITIDVSYYSSVLNEPAAVGHIVGKGNSDSSNKGEANITKTDRSSSSTSTSL